MNRTFFITSLLYLGLALPAHSADEIDMISGEHRSPPDFSGTWRLDKASSDDPEAKLQEAREMMRESRGMRGGMGGGFGRGKGGDMEARRQGSGRGRGRGASRGMPAASASEVRVLISSAEILELSHADPMLLISVDGGPQQRLFTDFRGAAVSASSSVPQAVTTAGWEGDVLVIETTQDSKPTLLQRYHLRTDSGQLEVITNLTLPGTSLNVSIKCFYDRANARTTSAAGVGS
ncbi:hypothetical protein [Sedimenticola selenatireducens]|uniref:hypothetical protein n=1 Tax=Sedimenticola selenatireducens TaxID=191960 RepID=UPI0012FBFE77|nr:hypothetical protein [Sedimenticola selenatireducens]